MEEERKQREENLKTLRAICEEAVKGIDWKKFHADVLESIHKSKTLQEEFEEARRDGSHFAMIHDPMTQ